MTEHFDEPRFAHSLHHQLIKAFKREKLKKRPKRCEILKNRLVLRVNAFMNDALTEIKIMMEKSSCVENVAYRGGN